MACYQKHVRFNLFLGLPISCLLLAKWTSLQEIIIFGSSFVLATLFFHPDLDIANKVKPFSLRGFFSLFFYPYAFLFRHRGISHKPIIGTLTRLVYLFAVIVLLCLIFSWEFSIVLRKEFLMGALGILLSDLCHLVLE